MKPLSQRLKDFCANRTTLMDGAEVKTLNEAIDLASEQEQLIAIRAESSYKRVTAWDKNKDDDGEHGYLKSCVEERDICDGLCYKCAHMEEALTRLAAYEDMTVCV